VAEAPTLEAQRAAWEALWVVRLLRAVPAWALSIIADFAALLFFNRLTLWWVGWRGTVCMCVFVVGWGDGLSERLGRASNIKVPAIDFNFSIKQILRLPPQVWRRRAAEAVPADCGGRRAHERVRGAHL
jgi:hypothetical protein